MGQQFVILAIWSVGYALTNLRLRQGAGALRSLGYCWAIVGGLSWAGVLGVDGALPYLGVVTQGAGLVLALLNLYLVYVHWRDVQKRSDTFRYVGATAWLVGAVLFTGGHSQDLRSEDLVSVFRGQCRQFLAENRGVEAQQAAQAILQRHPGDEEGRRCLESAKALIRKAAEKSSATSPPSPAPQQAATGAAVPVKTGAPVGDPPKDAKKMPPWDKSSEELSEAVSKLQHANLPDKSADGICQPLYACAFTVGNAWVYDVERRGGESRDESILQSYVQVRQVTSSEPYREGRLIKICSSGAADQGGCVRYYVDGAACVHQRRSPRSSAWTRIYCVPASGPKTELELHGSRLKVVKAVHSIDIERWWGYGVGPVQIKRKERGAHITYRLRGVRLKGVDYRFPTVSSPSCDWASGAGSKRFRRLHKAELRRWFPGWRAKPSKLLRVAHQVANAKLFVYAHPQAGTLVVATQGQVTKSWSFHHQLVGGQSQVKIWRPKDGLAHMVFSLRGQPDAASDKPDAHDRVAVFSVQGEQVRLTQFRTTSSERRLKRPYLNKVNNRCLLQIRAEPHLERVDVAYLRNVELEHYPIGGRLPLLRIEEQ